MRTALSIAGSDSSGGAGVQADLKTMTMNGVFAMSAITALTAQNTTGVTGILEADPEFLKKQIDAVFEDIRPDAVKIGMVSSSGLIKTIAERLQHYKAENIVVDGSNKRITIIRRRCRRYIKERIITDRYGNYTEYSRS